MRLLDRIFKRKPPGKLDKLSAALLNLNFTSGSLDSRINFSRTSNATVTGSNGLVQYAPMNLLTYSEQFDNAAWNGRTNITVSSNSTAAPDGTVTADKLVESTAAGQHGLYQTAGVFTANSVQSVSVYAKAAERSWLFVTFINDSNLGAWFDLSNGAVGTRQANNTSASITPAGNGWYRCVVTFSPTKTNPYLTFYTGTADNGNNYTGDGTSGLYIWGAQLELGSTATEYKPTTVKNLLGYTEHFDNAAWTKSNSFVQTNLVLQSEALDTASWLKSPSDATTFQGTGLQAVITANYGLDVNGNTTADRVQLNCNGGTTSSDRSGFNQAFTVTADIPYTVSVYIKPLDSTTDNQILNSSLCTLAAGSTPTSSAITDVGNGWKRVVRVYTPASSIATFRFQLVGSTGPQTFDGLIWGAQLVQGTSAGDYKATYAAAAAVGYTDIYGQPFAQKLVEDTATASHRVWQGVTTAAIPYTFSVHLKAAERSFAMVYTGVVNTGVMVNLTTGATNTVAGINAPTNVSVESVGNGWYRCSITFTATAALNTLFVYAALNSTTYNYTGDGTSGIYIFGAQLSDSASVDPYVYNPVVAPTSTAYYGPRFDYDASAISQNLLLQSESFSDAVWTKSSSSITANTAVAPNGTTTADTLTAAAANGFMYQLFSASAGVTYTFSCWIKSVSTSVSLELNLYTNIGASSVGNAIVTTTGDWQRVSVTATYPSASTSAWATIGGNASFTTGEAILIWGAQLEQNSKATDYRTTTVKNLLGYTQAFDNAAWTKSNSFVQTNLLTYSQDFDNTAWVKQTNASITANQTIAPDGTLSADLFTSTGVSPASLYQIVTTTANGIYTLSLRFKYASGRWFRFLWSDGTSNQARVWIDALNGLKGASDASGTAVSISSNVTNLGNGWYQVSLTASQPSTSGYFLITAVDADNSANPAAGSLYLWGAQLVQGSTPGNYQATGAVAAAIQYTDPIGLANAEKLVSASITSEHSVGQAISTLSGTMTFSCAMKQGEWRYGFLRTKDSGGTYRNVIFDLSNGDTVLTETGWGNVGSVSLGNGWYRCYGTITIPATTNFATVGGTNSTSAISVAGDGTSGIYIYGAQLSDSASVDPYVYNAAAAPVSAAVTVPLITYTEQLGSELVTNGDFSSASGWTIATGWTIVGGAASFSNSTGVSLTRTDLPSIPAGKWCKLEFDLNYTSGSGCTVALNIGGGVDSFGTFNSSGRKVAYVFTTVARTGVSITGIGGSVFSIDNISVKEYIGTTSTGAAPKGLLIEEQRTNLLTYSEQFDNAAWAKSSATVTPNMAVSPDGTVSADLVVSSTYVRQSVTIPASAARYTVSVYVKAAASNSFSITEAGATASSVSFNLSTGTFVITDTGGSPSATITSVGSGWYRCSFSYTSNGVQTTLFMNLNPASAYLWGAQLEAGAFATSYIPTVASQVTRAVDSASISGNNFARWYNVNSGTFYTRFFTEFSRASDATRYVLAMDNSSNKRVAYLPGGQTLACYDGATIVTNSEDITGQWAKMASAYSATDRALISNGTTPNTGAVAAGYSTSSSLNIGGPTLLCGWYSQIAYYPRRLANTELQGITA